MISAQALAAIKAALDELENKLDRIQEHVAIEAALVKLDALGGDYSVGDIAHLTDLSVGVVSEHVYRAGWRTWICNRDIINTSPGIVPLVNEGESSEQNTRARSLQGCAG